jgi:WD40 repeat protein
MVRYSGEKLVFGELLTRPHPSVPTLFVGIGGAGCRMVARVAKHLRNRSDDQDVYRRSTRFALVDANVNDLESYREVADQTFLISDFDRDAYADLASGKLFLEADPYFTQWVPSNYRSPVSYGVGAGQIRLEARLGVYYQMKHKDFVPRFRRLLEELMEDPRAHRDIRIVLCYSVAGGTGSGSYLPIAYMLRDQARQLGQPTLLGVAVLPAVFEELTGINRDGTFANGYAALKELEHLMRLGAPDSLFYPEEGLAFNYDPTDESKRTVRQQPFELVYVIDKPESARIPELVDAASDGLYLQLFSPLFGVQAADYDNYAMHRRSLVPREFERRGLLGFSTLYGSYGAAVLRVPVQGLVEYCAQAAALSLLRESFLRIVPDDPIYSWLHTHREVYDEVTRTDGKDEIPVRASEFIRKTPQQRDLLVDRLYMKRVRLLAACEHAHGIEKRFLALFRHGHRLGEVPQTQGGYELREERSKADLERLVRSGMQFSIAAVVLPAIAGRRSGDRPGLLEQAEKAIQDYAEENRLAVGEPRRLIELKILAESWVDNFRRVGIEVLRNGYREGAISYPGMDSLVNLQFLCSDTSEVNLAAKRYAALCILDQLTISTPPLRVYDFDLPGYRDTQLIRSRDDQVAIVWDLERQAIALAMAGVVRHYAELLGELNQQLIRFIDRQRSLEQTYAELERDRISHLEQLRQEGAFFSDQYVVEAEVLQIENGRRMWDFFYEDRVAGLPELGLNDPSVRQVLNDTISALSTSEESLRSRDLLDRLDTTLTDHARQILRLRIGGDPHASDRELRDGLTVADALEHEVIYRALYYADRSRVEPERGGGVRALLRAWREIPPESGIRIGALRHRDYLRDKVKRLIRDQLKLFSAFNEERTPHGGLRPAHLLLAVVDEGLRNAAVVSEVLSADPGITWVTSGWHNPREVLFYRSVLNVPLYVFGRMKEMKAEYKRFQRLSRRSKMLHIDRNWETSLPDLDPESAIERVTWETAPPPSLDEVVSRQEAPPSSPLDWTYDVFLSFSSSHEALAERLAQKLVEAGLRPFFSKWHLIPGEPWQEALEKALDTSRVYAVLVGPGGFGPWQNEEVRSVLDERARDGSLRVIPVLLPGAGLSREDGFPRFLRRLTRVSFGGDLEDERAFKRLLSGIRGETPGHGGVKGASPAAPYRSMAPPPEGFILRREYEEVVQALLAGQWSEGEQGLESLVGLQIGARAVGITTALRGAGGFGKTALAQAVCQEKRVRQAYPDGILWTTMGEKLDDAGRLARLRDLIRWWSDQEPPAFETLDAGSAHLRGLLAARRVLLVIDDVWRPDDIAPFHGLGAGTVLLVTTRDGSTLPDSATTVVVDAMAPPEAMALLGAELPESKEEELRQLASRLGEWPLLLKIVNRQLQELAKEGLTVEEALQEVREALEAEGLTAFDNTSSESRNRAVAGTLDASLSALSRQERDLFSQLAIFPEDVDMPLTVLPRLWDLDSHRVKRLCGRLYSLSLLLRFDRPSGTIRLHDVVHTYLQQKQRERLPKTHQQFLKACLPASGRWTDLPPEETYLWRHLAHHMIDGGRSGELRELLLDFEYLQAKLRAMDANTLLADYAALAPQHPELLVIQEALSLAASTLTKDGRELAGQLLGRLGDVSDAGIQHLLQGARDWREGAWLRPRTRSLLQSENEPPRLREGHTNGINALALLGRTLVSASSDRTLRLWSLESAEAIDTFEGHAAGVNAVAILDENHVVSGSDDGTLRVWDLRSGKTARLLTGHTGWVRALAVLDEHRIISGSEDGTLRVWDAETGETLHILRGHTAGIRAVTSIDGRLAVSGSIDGTLRVWDLENGQPLLTQSFATAISVMAKVDSRRVALGSDDGTLWVWDLAAGTPIRSFAGHRAWIFALAVLSDHHASSSAGDRTVRVWNLETGERVSTFTLDAPATAIVGCSDGRMLVAGDTSGCLHFLDFVENK